MKYVQKGNYFITIFWPFFFAENLTIFPNIDTHWGSILTLKWRRQTGKGKLENKGGIFSHTVYLYLTWGPVTWGWPSAAPFYAYTTWLGQRVGLRSGHPVQYLYTMSHEMNSAQPQVILICCAVILWNSSLCLRLSPMERPKGEDGGGGVWIRQVSPWE